MGGVLGNGVRPIHKMKIYEKYVKRPLDSILLLCAILVLPPVSLLVTILVKIKLDSPVIFKQERPGLYDKILSMHKFRTMTDEKDENGNLLLDEKCLTGLGRILRSTSLDELLELFCTLSDCMSYIGLRPLPMKYLPRYNQRQPRRHEVKPDLTGYTRAYGRNSLVWEEKFKKDVYYVEHMSLWLDVMILFKTVAVILK